MNINGSRTEQRLIHTDTIYIEVLSSPSTDNSNHGCTDIAICNTIDISTNGLQITTNRKLPIGSILQLCVQLSQENKRLFLVGEVKWLRKIGEEDYTIGFSLFESEDSDIQGWKELLAQLL